MGGDGGSGGGGFEVSGFIWSRYTHHARKHAGTHAHTERQDESDVLKQ